MAFNCCGNSPMLWLGLLGSETGSALPKATQLCRRQGFREARSVSGRSYPACPSEAGSCSVSLVGDASGRKGQAAGARPPPGFLGEPPKMQVELLFYFS